MLPVRIAEPGRDESVQGLADDFTGGIAEDFLGALIEKRDPKAVVDLATLTGACVVALGRGMAAGIFSTEDALRDKLLAASEVSHERLWPLPLWDDYRKAIKSSVADMKNSGGRMGGGGGRR